MSIKVFNKLTRGQWLMLFNALRSYAYIQIMRHFKSLPDLIPVKSKDIHSVDLNVLSTISWCLHSLKKHGYPEPSCLIICLVGSRLLQSHAQDFDLHIGVAKSSHLHAHAWLSAYGYAVWGENEENNFTPITTL